ncbi:MAG: hypothetical protein RLN70_02515 [Rhodospirillaceae bacterium]
MVLKTPLSLAFLEEQPRSAARVFETMPQEAAASFLNDLPAGAAAETLAHMIPAVVAAILSRLEPRRAAYLLSAVERPAAAAILRVWGRGRDAVMDALPKRMGASLLKVLSYAPHFVGARMDPTAPSLDGAMTTADAMKRLEAVKPLPDIIAVEGRGGQFQGVVWIRDLVAASDMALLQTIADTSHTPLVDVQSLTTAMNHEGWQDTVILPVVDGGGEFVGMIRRRALDSGPQETVVEGPPGLQFFAYLAQVFRHCVVGIAAMIAGSFEQPGSRER